MSYTAFEKMREENLKNHVGDGPRQPELRDIPNAELSLTQAAIRFLHHSCENLRFKNGDGIDDQNGTSAGVNQIPYNMQMDVDRLCLEKALERFLESGVLGDTFDVYFCYLEMFVDMHGESRRMIELLSEFESNASSLRIKHRDCYSHSVYVFSLGLAIYETNSIYREMYQTFYGITDQREAAHHYLKYWGLSALFHEIGDSRVDSFLQPDCNTQPLAYMLMLCDKLQCWDLTSYSRNSRTELGPMDCSFTFVNNGIQATYIYDEEEKEKIDIVKTNFENEIKSGIERIFKGSLIKLDVSVMTNFAKNAPKNESLSNSNFLHLYNFALALNARYDGRQMSEEKMADAFEKLSLEYKISNIRQAKKFADHLNEIGCFYTDRPVACEMVKQFSNEELLKLGPSEHQRWEDEKLEMCWVAGEKFDNKCKREQTRIHNLLNTKYDELSKEEQLKDTEPLNKMLELLQKNDGVRVYRIQ